MVAAHLLAMARCGLELTQAEQRMLDGTEGEAVRCAIAYQIDAAVSPADLHDSYGGVTLLRTSRRP